MILNGPQLDDRDTEINETIVFIIRETGWTMEYTRMIVGSLSVKKLKSFVDELRYQKAIDEYRLLRAVAVAVAVWASSQSQGRSYAPEDIIGNQPTREDIKRR